jgi:hypothetical protein
MLLRMLMDPSVPPKQKQQIMQELQMMESEGAAEGEGGLGPMAAGGLGAAAGGLLGGAAGARFGKGLGAKMGGRVANMTENLTPTHMAMLGGASGAQLGGAAGYMSGAEPQVEDNPMKAYAEPF